MPNGEFFIFWLKSHSLKLTAKAPENGWLEYNSILSFWDEIALFSGGKLAGFVSGRVMLGFICFDHTFGIHVGYNLERGPMSQPLPVKTSDIMFPGSCLMSLPWFVGSHHAFEPWWMCS